MRIANLNQQARQVLSNLVPQALQRDHYHHVLGWSETVIRIVV